MLSPDQIITIGASILIPSIGAWFVHKRWQNEQERAARVARMEGRNLYEKELRAELKDMRDEYRELKKKYDALLLEHSKLLARLPHLEGLMERIAELETELATYKEV